MNVINETINKFVLNNKNKKNIVINSTISNIFASIDVEKFSYMIKLLIETISNDISDELPVTMAITNNDRYHKILITDHRSISINYDISNIFDPLRMGVEKAGIEIKELHLAVARGLAELHGGHLNARMNDTNDGLTFELLIPN